MYNKILITGGAGFIGSHTSLRLLARGDEVVGFDNVNAYYDPSLKEARLARLAPHHGFRLVRGELGESGLRGRRRRGVVHEPLRFVRLRAIQRERSV